MMNKEQQTVLVKYYATQTTDELNKTISHYRSEIELTEEKIKLMQAVLMFRNEFTAKQIRSVK